MPLTPLLRCLSTDDTRRFYGSVLGFDVHDSAEGTLTVERGGARLIFTSADLWNGAPALTGTLYLTVPDVDALYAAVRDRATIAWPPQDMPYGSREFGLRDPNGYHLAFQQQGGGAA